MRGNRGAMLLHLSDTGFGTRHRFGAGEHNSLAARLLQDLDNVRDDDRLDAAIDLVVISGDIADTGKTSEYEHARTFVDELLDGLSLDSDRLVLVPGNHDVNRKLCEAHFLTQEAKHEEPIPPYAAKWKPYEAFVAGLHGEAAFTPDQPYRMHRFDDLGLAVAALNSTIAESHEVHHGRCGEAQLRWFARELQDGEHLTRIAVVHHNVRRRATLDDENLHDEDDFTRILGPHLDLVLHGHSHDGKEDRLSDGTLVLATGSAAVAEDRRYDETPNQYQVLRFTPGLLVRGARQYVPNQKGWVGDTRIGDGAHWVDEIEFANRGRALAGQLDPQLRSSLSARTIEEFAAARDRLLGQLDREDSPRSSRRVSDVPPAGASKATRMGSVAATDQLRTIVSEQTAALVESKRAARSFDVFLCYSSQDRGVVRTIAERLMERGILPWLDEWELRPGQPWQRLLEEQVGRIKAAAVFVGPSGVGPWHRHELDAFLREFAERSCPVIPVLLPDCPEEPELPIFLRGMTWVDFRTDEPDPLDQLVWGVTGERPF